MTERKDRTVPAILAGKYHGRVFLIFPYKASIEAIIKTKGNPYKRRVNPPR
ncbi:MAG: hypothetical protein QW472_05510 [Candidatus Aenigmatarchaeota archaeon]